MRGEELDRLLSPASRRIAEEYLSQIDESPNSPDFDLIEALDRNLADTLAAYDPGAALTRFLSLRFSGDQIDGRLPEVLVEEVLEAFRKELAGASPPSVDQARLQLDLVGFSRGSAILHFAPRPMSLEGATDPAGEQAAFGADAVDSAVQVIADLHRAAENQGDMTQFAARANLVTAFVTLTDALERHNADLDVMWRSSTGARRLARLTARGRAHVRRNLERRESAERSSFTGRIVRLDLNGSFSIKLGQARNSKRVDIDAQGEDNLLGLGLRLGETVSVDVSRTVVENNLGIVQKGRYRLLSIARQSSASSDR